MHSPETSPKMPVIEEVIRDQVSPLLILNLLRSVIDGTWPAYAQERGIDMKSVDTLEVVYLHVHKRRRISVDTPLEAAESLQLARQLHSSFEKNDRNSPAFASALKAYLLLYRLLFESDNATKS